MSRRLGEWILEHRTAVLAALGLVTMVFAF